LLPKPWQYDAPVIELSTFPFDRHHVVPAVSLIGDLASAAAGLSRGLTRSPWAAADLQALKAGMRERATGPKQETISATFLSQTVCRLLPANARIAVDAGAHMLPVMAFFEARNPHDALISRGLATMGYALPSAIGAALAQPDRPVVALTGDGGLMMCAAELATAAQVGCRLTVVVFNDSAIAMIGVKQNQRGLARHGMDYSHSDFSLVARGYGCHGERVEDPGALEATLQRALAGKGTSLVDVVVDPSGYDAQIGALRG
jgi:acetolactate synthase-1/2/3 large subunit